MTSDSHVYELVELGLYKDAAAALGKRGELPTHLRVLRAELLVHLDTPQKAIEAAQQLLKERLTHQERARCWEILGKTNLSLGHLEEGLRAMRKAFAASSQSGDAQVEARLTAAYVHGLLHWVGLEAAALEIARLRQAAVTAADPRIMIAYHQLMAELAARKGLVASANASLDIVRGLLSRFPNAWHEGRLAIVSMYLAILASDYEAALSDAQQALACGERSGSREILIPAMANLATVQLHTRSLDQARESLDRLLPEMRKSGVSITEIGVRDIEMQLAMASGELELASTVEKQIQQLSEQINLKDSYYELWHLVARVKWLFLKGDPATGLALAMDSGPRAERLADRFLLERLTLAAAEGLGRTGRDTDGAELLAQAANANRDPSLETLAERLRIAGRLAARDDPPAARSHFDRALHILAGIGNLTARAEVERDRDELLGPDEVEPDRRPPAAQHAERFATLIRLGAHAPLLAAEAFSLLVETDAVLQASICEIGPDGQSRALRTWPSQNPTALEAEHGPSVRIEVGRRGDRTYEIVAVPRRTASARTTVLAIEQLVQSSHAVARGKEIEREQAALWTEPAPDQQLGLICVSERMRDLVKTVRRVAESRLTVLLTGETGVGKELFARALHTASARNDRVFLPFNCTTVPHDMLDRELRLAAGGTLFLDEIGELSLDTQPKLLRFLESGEILPPGEAPQQVDVRVVAATNADLDQLVTQGRFREDLFYRLNVIRIHVPPLRERREEIPALVEHFLDRYGRELQKPALRVADETLEYLVLFRWPGNVRQLANEVRRMAALAEPGAVLMPEHLAAEIVAGRRTIPAERIATETTEVLTRTDQPLAAAVEHVERAVIQHALAVCDGRIDEAAQLLGLSRKGLYLKRQRLGLD